MNGLQPTHTDKLGPKIQKIWPALGNLPPEYTLIGGTAIALYCGHRQSVDIDLSCSGPAEHPRRTRERIAAEIGKHKVFQRRSGIVVKFFETPGSPKIEIHGTDPWTQKAPRRRAENGLLIAAPSDLAARKLYAMSARDVERDGWDLQALFDAGTDMAAAARSFLEQASTVQVETLHERLHSNPGARWPELTDHKQLLDRLDNATRGYIEPPPREITFKERDDGRFDINQRETDTGSTNTLTSTDTIPEGLAWLAAKRIVAKEEIPRIERNLLEDTPDRGAGLHAGGVDPPNTRTAAADRQR